MAGEGNSLSDEPPRDHLQLYLTLARASSRRQLLVRDELLLLAAEAAHRRSLDRVAGYCRLVILGHNPGHVIGRFETVSQGMHDETVARQITKLRRRYPPEKCEHLLSALGVQLAQPEGEPRQWAAELLGTTTEELATLLDHHGRYQGTQPIRPQLTRQDPYRGLSVSRWRRWRGRLFWAALLGVTIAALVWVLLPRTR